MSPIQNAINTMREKNNELQVLIGQHAKDPSLNINPLTMVLNGVIDAAVMGGTDKYRQAFFNDTFKSADPGNPGKVEELQQLMITQIKILEGGLLVHGRYCSPEQKPMQNKLELQLADMKVKNGMAAPPSQQGPPQASTSLPASLPATPAPPGPGLEEDKKDVRRRLSSESQKSRLPNLLSRGNGSSSSLNSDASTASSLSAPNTPAQRSSMYRTQTISGRPGLAVQDPPMRRTHSVTSKPLNDASSPASNPFADSPAPPQPSNSAPVLSGQNTPVPPPRTKSVSMHSPNPFAMAQQQQQQQQQHTPMPDRSVPSVAEEPEEPPAPEPEPEPSPEPSPEPADSPQEDKPPELPPKETRRSFSVPQVADAPADQPPPLPPKETPTKFVQQKKK